jgi:bla regulator protein blaR1
MITSIMVFCVAVSTVAAVAAWMADEGLRRVGIPTRWIWFAAMAACPALLLLPLVLSRSGSAVLGELAALGVVTELAAIDLAVASGGGGLVTLDRALAGMWAVAMLVLLVVLYRTHAGLRSERAGWESRRLFGREVYLSTDRGPAVAGSLRPWIVLPRWALALTETQLGLVVLHEEEHVRGGDTKLLPLALALVALTPWNPVSWIQLRRLRMAMELDCDRRVLRQRPDREEYGNSLLTVAARASGTSLGLASFTERSLTLQRRIIAMTDKRSHWTSFRAALFSLIAVAVGLQACGVESPVSVDGRAVEVQESLVDGAPVNLRDRPMFTPFTVAPAITNRDEVVAAMNRDYPPLLRDAGVGGTVQVYFFINEDGRVEQTRLNVSSGHAAIDEAALNVAGAYQFTPALNKDVAVPVWVSFGITFQSDRGDTPPDRPANTR